MKFSRRCSALALCSLPVFVIAASSAAASVASWPARAVPAPAADLAGAPLQPGAALRPSEDDSPRSTLPLLFPVPGGRALGLEKHFLSRRGRKLHHAVDIRAPRNTPIRAVAAGTIVRLRRSPLGGIGVEQRDPSGRYCFYYAHLQRYAPGLKVGQTIGRDELLGFVGSTGRARGPHLHFQVFELDRGASDSCWSGTPLDPAPLLRPEGEDLAKPRDAPRQQAR